MVETLRLTLEPSLTAPSEARHALGEWLEQTSCDGDQRDGLLLAISELVTNVVVHTGSRSEVLALLDDGRVRLEVHDSRHAPPIEQVDGDGRTGFGLRLVGTFTDGWGWRPTPTGKFLWTETLC